MTAMTVDPPTDRSEDVSFSTVLANTGLTRRQLDFWCHRSYITAVPGERGSGRPRVFTADEYMVICHAYDLTALGLGPEQAVELARRLCGNPSRFNDIRRAIPVVTQKSLTATLRRLERNGMIDRVVLNTRPVAVEYRVTPLGDTLQDLVDALLRWTALTLDDVEEARDRYDAAAGT